MSCSCGQPDIHSQQQSGGVFAFGLNFASPLPSLATDAIPRSPQQDTQHQQGFSTPSKKDTFLPRSDRNASAATYMQCLYYDTLWLGEAYAPLQDFVRCMSRLVEQRLSTNDLACLGELLQLILTPTECIARKMRETLPAQLRSILSSSSAMQTAIVELRQPEWDAIACSLRSGPAESVKRWVENSQSSKTKDTAQEGTTPEPVPFVGIVKRWLSEIECRELQMQVIVTLFALRICASNPTALQQFQTANNSLLAGDLLQGALSNEATKATESINAVNEEKHSSQGDEANGPQDDDSQKSESKGSANDKKKKRKSAPARRWTGGRPGGVLGGPDAAFTWSRKGNSKASVTAGGESQGDASLPAAPAAGVAEEADVIALDPETLSKRFDALIERLCLVALQNELSSVMLPDSQSSEIGPRDAKVDPSRTDGKVLFGSAARLKGIKDERDQLQWLCSSIIEPVFSKTLPRQCNTLRSKCFVAGGNSGPSFSNTPGRQLQRTRTESSLHDGVQPQLMTPRTAAKHKFETNLLRREERRKRKERAVQESQPRFQEVLKEEIESKNRRRGGSASRTGSIEPEAASASRSLVLPGSKDNRRAPKEIQMERRFVRSASASITASRLQRETSCPPGRMPSNQRKASGVFTTSRTMAAASSSAAPRHTSGRSFERAQSLAPASRASERSSSLAPAPKSFERSQSVAPSHSGSRASSTADARAESQEDHPVEDRVALQDVQSTNSLASSVAKPPADDKDARASAEASEAEETDSEEEEGKHQSEEEEIIIPRKRKALGDRSVSSTLGKWMKLDASFEESSHSSSMGLTASEDKAGTAPVRKEQQFSESQPVSFLFQRSRNPFEDNNTTGSELATAAAEGKVSSNRNPFAKNARTSSASLRSAPQARALAPILGNSAQGLSELGDEQDILMAESCPAELGRLWRGAVQAPDVL